MVILKCCVSMRSKGGQCFSCLFLPFCLLCFKVNNFAIRHDVEMWRTAAGGNHMKSECVDLGVTRDSRDQITNSMVVLSVFFMDPLGLWRANDLWQMIWKAINKQKLISNKDVDFLFE